MTITADHQLAAAVDEALAPVLCDDARPPVLVGARLATGAEMKAAAGARALALAAGWGWTVQPTYAAGWRQRPQPGLIIDLTIGEVAKHRDGAGTATRIEVWERTESLAVRMQHHGTGLRAVGLWTRHPGPRFSETKGVQKPATWSASAPELWWWRLDPARQFDPVPYAECYPRPVAVADLKSALASEATGDDLVALFEALPVKTDEKDED